MSNEIALYSTLTGIQLDSKAITIPDMLKYNRTLKSREVDKVLSAVNNELYDMAAEYFWSRVMDTLKKDIMQFGAEFVAEMLDRPNGNVDFISEQEIITLSADLGFINNTAKMEFLQYSETIQHYRSNTDSMEEYPYTKLIDMIRSCISHVLGLETIEYEVSFAAFREGLKKEVVNERHSMYSQIMSAPYFYKKTITKTLLNLAKTLPNSAERENVFANITILVPGLWSALSSDDKWFIGRTYAQANNEGDVSFFKALKSLLIQTNGFDFVPENLRSNSYIQVAKDLLTVHFGMNNFYNEPAYAKLLCEMGSSIPMPALGACMTAIIACKLGNRYGKSWGAQNYLDKLLDNISPERWRYYLCNILPNDETVLYKLAFSLDLCAAFQEIVVKYKLDEIRFNDATINKLMHDFQKGNLRIAKDACAEMYQKIVN